MLANVLMLAPTLYMLQVYDRVLASQRALTLGAISILTRALFAIMALAEWMTSSASSSVSFVLSIWQNSIQ